MVQDGKHPSEKYDFPSAEPLAPEAERALALSIERQIDSLRQRFTDRIHRFLQANYHQMLAPTSLLHLERGAFRSAIESLESSSGQVDDFQQLLTKSLYARLGKFEGANDELASAGQMHALSQPNDILPRGLFTLDSDDLLAVDAAIRQIRSTAQQLIAVHTRTVMSLSKAYMGRGVSLDDLKQEAHLGLRKAVMAYQPTTNVPLSAFARKVIRTHLIDVTRAAHDGNSHTGRDIADYYDAYERLAHRFGRNPSDDEIAAELNVTPQQFAKLLGIRGAVEKQGLPTGDGSDSSCLWDKQDGEAEVCEMGTELHAAINNLPSDQREVIMLHYFQGVTTLKEVANRLGLTIDQVRYRHRVAIDTLGGRLGVPKSRSHSKRLA